MLLPSLLIASSLLLTTARAIIVAGPSGPWSVSYSTRELVDESRWDPYAPENKPHRRRIMTSLFVPVTQDEEQCEIQRLDYLPPTTLETYSQIAVNLGLPANVFEGLELEVCQSTRNGHERHQQKQKHPVVIFSPGFSYSRLLSSAQAMSLASRGYVVVTVDHPYEATVVEFPDGTAVYGLTIADANVDTAGRAAEVRSHDISFVIDQLFQTCSSSLGRELKGVVDKNKIFAYGHSVGGASSALAALYDSRVTGGLNFDGMLFPPVTEAGLDVPFFIAGPEATANQTAGQYGDFMDKLRGPKMLLTVDETQHMSFIDVPLILSLRNDVPLELEPRIEAVFGTISGGRFAVLVDSLLGAVTEFVFGADGDICHFEDRAIEFEVIERSITNTC